MEDAWAIDDALVDRDPYLAWERWSFVAEKLWLRLFRGLEALSLSKGCVLAGVRHVSALCRWGGKCSRRNRPCLADPVDATEIHLYKFQQSFLQHFHLKKKNYKSHSLPLCWPLKGLGLWSACLGLLKGKVVPLQGFGTAQAVVLHPGRAGVGVAI